MSDLALALLTALLGALKSRRDLVLENLALRHQLAVLASSDKRPRFRPADRLVWTCLRRLWDGWKRGSPPRSAGNRRSLAPGRIPPLLGTQVSSSAGKAKGRSRTSVADPEDGHRKPALGDVVAEIRGRVAASIAGCPSPNSPFATGSATGRSITRRWWDEAG